MRRLSLSLAVIGVMSFAAPAGASTFTVTGFADASGASCAGKSCDSLRAAVALAEQAQNVGSTVQLVAGTYALNAPLTLTRDVTIAGSGQISTTIRQTAASDVIEVTSPVANVTIDSLAITGGSATGSAGGSSAGSPGLAVGAIVDDGSLTLDSVSVVGNKATGGTGGTQQLAPGPGGQAVGAIEVSGSLTLKGCDIERNEADGGAGGTVLPSGTQGGTGGEAFAAIDIAPGAGSVSIAASTISGNAATGGVGGAGPGSGSGVDGAGGDAFGAVAQRGTGTLTISSTTLSSNTATGNVAGPDVFDPLGSGGTAQGAGLYANAGTVTVGDSAIEGNTATGGSGEPVEDGPGPGGSGGEADGGGLVIRSPATLTLVRSGVSLNTATGGSGGQGISLASAPGVGGDGDGGGAFITGDVTIVNSTVAENVAAGSAGGSGNGVAAGTPGRGIGGGISVQDATTTLASDTIATNASAAAGGGALYGGDLDKAGLAGLTLTDTIVSGGIAGSTDGDCSEFGSAPSDGGHNLESDSSNECELGNTGDVLGTDPALGALKNNGGLSLTMAPAASSPARSAGGSCTDPTLGGAPLTNDQRGEPRHAPCDIGAFEAQPPQAISAPTIIGSGVVGQTLSCSTTGFTGDGLSFTFQWLRNGSAIRDATGPSYTPTAADVGHAISCRVTATGAYGTSSSTSAAKTITAKPTAHKFTGARLAAKIIAADHKHLKLTLSCPAKPPGGRCTIRLIVFSTAGAVPPIPKPKRRHKALKAAVEYASTRLTLRAGAKKTIRLTLTAAGAAALKHLPASARVALSSRDRTGAKVSKVQRVRITLR